ncbi:MAG TPA: hypothetical protein PLX97_12145 [Gemmatales bacterium]|nr:hypothetical protein [Gemmatales bacterium]
MSRLAIVELRFRHWATAVQWFQQHLQLGTVLEHADQQYALLEAGSIRLGIKGDAEAIITRQVLLQWEVEDVVAWQEAASITIVKPLKISSEGYRRIIIEGPEGMPILLFDWRQQATA